MKSTLIYFFIILNLTCVLAFAPNFSEINYYGEVIDIGLKDYNFSEDIIIKIIILNDYETYFSRNYGVLEIDEISIVLDTQVSADARVIYEIYNDLNKIAEKEFYLNLFSIEDLPNFFFCLSPSCEKEEIPVNYDFWAEDGVYLLVEGSLEKYSVAISIDSENNTLFFDNNITLPYEIPKNLITGYDNYTLNIELTDKETNRQFNQKLYFSLNELTREEHKEIMFEILDIDIAENKDRVEIVGINDNKIKTTPFKNPQTEETYLNKYNGFYILLFVSVIIFIIIILFVPKSRRKERKV